MKKTKREKKIMSKFFFVLLFSFCVSMGKAQDCRQLIYNYIEKSEQLFKSSTKTFYYQKIEMHNILKPNKDYNNSISNTEIYTGENMMISNFNDIKTICLDSLHVIEIDHISKEIIIKENRKRTVNNSFYDEYKRVIESCSLKTCEKWSELGKEGTKVVLSTHDDYRTDTKVSSAIFFFSNPNNDLYKIEINFDKSSIMQKQISTYTPIEKVKNMKFSSCEDYIFDNKKQLRKQFKDYKIVK